MNEILKDKNIYIAPKNIISEFVRFKLENKGFEIKAFIDNFKKDDDVIVKNTFGKDDVVLLYSPNHYKQIIANITCEHIYILELENNEIKLCNFEDFKGYEKASEIDYNEHLAQRFFWQRHLKEYENSHEDLENYGYTWGDPENPNDPLGDYLAINKLLRQNINENSTILEIGSLGGKWTKYMLRGGHLILVDINEYFIDVIKKRFSKEHTRKMEFYISRGNELKGIKDKSVDVVFCLDTLVRVKKEFIFDYIKEIKRVLKEQGKAILHLPNSDSDGSVQRNFTALSTKQIEDEFKKYFDDFVIDTNIIHHGCIVFVNFKGEL